MAAAAGQMATIRVERERSGWTDRARAYRVFVDGVEVGRLANGESGDYPADPGRHELFLKIDWCRSEKLTLDLAQGEMATVRARARSPWGALYWISFGRHRYVDVELAAS